MQEGPCHLGHLLQVLVRWGDDQAGLQFLADDPEKVPDPIVTEALLTICIREGQGDAEEGLVVSLVRSPDPQVVSKILRELDEDLRQRTRNWFEEMKEP